MPLDRSASDTIATPDDAVASVDMAITRIVPGRGRAGDAVEVQGRGFGSTAAANTVTVDGQAATIVSARQDSIRITVPGGIATDRHVDVVVTNTTDSTTDTERWWSARSAASLATGVQVPIALPGRDEAPVQFVDEPTFPQRLMARTWERLVARAELVQFDLLTAKGAAMARGSTGLVRVAPGSTAGHPYLRGTTEGGVFRARVNVSLAWGRAVQAAEGSEVFLVANAVDGMTTSQGEDHVVPAAGRVAILSLVSRRVSPTADNINRVRLLVNGVEAFDSSDDATNLPAVVQGGTWRAYPWVTVAAGDRLSIGVTKSGTTSEANVVGAVMII